MKLNGIYLSAHQKTITKDMVEAKKKFFEYIPLKAKTCRNNICSTHIKTKFLIYMAAEIQNNSKINFNDKIIL